MKFPLNLIALIAGSVLFCSNVHADFRGSTQAQLLDAKGDEVPVEGGAFLEDAPKGEDRSCDDYDNCTTPAAAGGTEAAGNEPAPAEESASPEDEAKPEGEATPDATGEDNNEQDSDSSEGDESSDADSAEDAEDADETEDENQDDEDFDEDD